MELFVYITSKTDTVTPILKEMMEKDIHGATVVDCQGMLGSIDSDSDDAPPIFGSLRQYLNPQGAEHKMIFAVIKDEDFPVVKQAIHDVCGSLKTPNTGIFFTVPITNWEGVAHK